jgi:hypothetical protein
MRDSNLNVQLYGSITDSAVIICIPGCLARSTVWVMPHGAGALGLPRFPVAQCEAKEVARERVRHVAHMLAGRLTHCAGGEPSERIAS